MGQHPGAQVVAGGEQRAALTGRDPVEAAAQPGMERHVPAGLEQERVEVRLAELPIAGPRGAGLVGGERSDVNEGRARPDPLDVERGRVLEGHPLVERGQGEVELQQGGIQEHAERPFVGVRHDRDARMLEHAGPLRRQLREAVPFHHLPRADQSALLAEVAVEACLRKPLPVRERAPREAAEHAAGMVEDAGIRVAERPGSKRGGVLAPVAVDRAPSPPRSWAKTEGSPQVHVSDARDRRDGLRQARV